MPKITNLPKISIMDVLHSQSWMVCVMYRTQFSATVAAQSLLHSESGHKFQAHPAPGPDEMNWQALWKTWQQKDIRRVLVFPLIVGVIIFPLGIFAGALSKLTDVLCDENGIAYIGHSYCGVDDQDAWLSPQKIISGWAPPVVVSIWQNSVMPNLIYFLVQVGLHHAGLCPCRSLMDKGCDQLDSYIYVMCLVVGAGIMHILEWAWSRDCKFVLLLGCAEYFCGRYVGWNNSFQSVWAHPTEWEYYCLTCGCTPCLLKLLHKLHCIACFFSCPLSTDATSSRRMAVSF